MKGIFITEDILQDERLNMNEKVILSYYKYFTEQGEYKCCSISNEAISGYLKINIRTFNRAKKHLIELGLIKSNGGIKIVYLGNGEGQNDLVEGQNDLVEGQNDLVEGQNDLVEGQNDTHNKEKKEKKEEKTNNKNDIVLDNECNEFVHETKEIVEQTNYDKAYSEIYSNETVIYPEAKEWIRSRYSDTIDKLNSMTPQQYNDSENMIVSFIAGKFKEFKLNKRMEGYGSPR